MLSSTGSIGYVLAEDSPLLCHTIRVKRVRASWEDGELGGMPTGVSRVSHIKGNSIEVQIEDLDELNNTYPMLVHWEGDMLVVKLPHKVRVRRGRTEHDPVRLMVYKVREVRVYEREDRLEVEAWPVGSVEVRSKEMGWSEVKESMKEMGG